MISILIGLSLALILVMVGAAEVGRYAGKRAARRAWSEGNDHGWSEGFDQGMQAERLAQALRAAGPPRAGRLDVNWDTMIGNWDTMIGVTGSEVSAIVDSIGREVDEMIRRLHEDMP